MGDIADELFDYIFVDNYDSCADIQHETEKSAQPVEGSPEALKNALKDETTLDFGS